MAVTAWVLVQTEVGKARHAADLLAAMEAPGVKVLTADTVTGPYDIIARLEGDSLDNLTNAVERTLEHAGGVQDTITCLAIHMA
jgi:DNA-binding Lrp family transcriptional regulator